MDSNVTITKINVGGMSCMHCVHAVKTALESVPGVKSASVDLASETAEIVHDNHDGILENIKKAVTDAGYSVRN